MTASDYLSEIIKYTRLKKIHVVIANDSPIKPKNEAVAIDSMRLNKFADNVITADLASAENPDWHDSKKIEKVIRKII